MSDYAASLLLILACVSAQAGEYTLLFDRPARHFEESCLIGNGSAGAAVYGDPLCDTIFLNDITLWTGEPLGRQTLPDLTGIFHEVRMALERGDYPKADSLQHFLQWRNSAVYQPAGMIEIEYIDHAPVAEYERRLSLDSAIVTTRVVTSGLHSRTTRYFATAPDSLIVMDISSTSPFNAIVRYSSQLPCDISAVSGGIITADGYAAYDSSADGHKLYDPSRGIHYRTAIRAISPDGRIVAQPDGALQLIGCRNATLLVAIATSYNGPFNDPVSHGRNYRELASGRINTCLNSDTLLLRHLSDYQALFSAVSLDLGTTSPDLAARPLPQRLLLYTDSLSTDPDLEEMYFQTGRYLLIASSRTPGVPANLQGLWNESMTPPWSGNYTTNINLEENYWPAATTGLDVLQETALLPWLENASITGREPAEKFYGTTCGWSMGHNSDIWAMSAPAGDGAGDPSWACWNMGGAWLSPVIFDHYRFTLRHDLLERYYPVLRGAAQFCLGILVDSPCGLVTSPSTSPENIYMTPEGYSGATLTGATADISIIRECLTATRQAAETLDTDLQLRHEIDSVLARLHNYSVTTDGRLSEWLDPSWGDADPRHRHQSHLAGLYPGTHITPESTPILAAAASKTLDVKGENTTGWSAAWRVALRARLHEGDKAYSQLRRLMRYVSPERYRGPQRRTGGGTYPNLLCAHPPFQIDGNFGATAGIAEMLLQSVDGRIHLLPALPKAWSHGSVRGLRARGGYIVDIDWNDSKVTDFKVTPLQGANHNPELVYAED